MSDDATDTESIVGVPCVDAVDDALGDPPRAIPSNFTPEYGTHESGCMEVAIVTGFVVSIVTCYGVDAAFHHEVVATITAVAVLLLWFVGAKFLVPFVAPSCPEEIWKRGELTCGTIVDDRGLTVQFEVDGYRINRRIKAASLENQSLSRGTPVAVLYMPDEPTASLVVTKAALCALSSFAEKAPANDA